MRIVDYAGLRWSDDGRVLYFGIKEREKKAVPDTVATATDSVSATGDSTAAGGSDSTKAAAGTGDEDNDDEDDKEFDKFPRHSVTGTWGHQIIPELAPAQEDIVIQKRRYSGFYETELSDVLEKIGVKEVEVVGVCTNICVMDTVGGLANRDYAVTVPKDGVADFDPEFHAFALKRMEKIYGARII